MIHNHCTPYSGNDEIAPSSLITLNTALYIPTVSVSPVAQLYSTNPSLALTMLHGWSAIAHVSAFTPRIENVTLLLVRSYGSTPWVSMFHSSIAYCNGIVSPALYRIVTVILYTSAHIIYKGLAINYIVGPKVLYNSILGA